MSLRAIKKRENQLNPISRPTLFKKSTSSSPLHQQQQQQQQQQRSKPSTLSSGSAFRSSNSNNNTSVLQQQRVLLGRATHSNPELRIAHPSDSDTLERLAAAACLVRTKSESDVNALLDTCNSNLANGLLSAKSEVCLQTISSHSYNSPTHVTNTNNSTNTNTNTATPSSSTSSPPQRPQSQNQFHPEQQQQQQLQQQQMFSSGARSHRDLTQSAYAGSGDMMVSPARRRLSECSLNSSVAYSQRTSAMSSSALTLSSSPPSEPNSVMRVPIIGYEVMEERARFTVYKLRVENPVTNDCWLVLRRYTDFVRLNTKLKQTFPYMSLLLPRKKIFGDNFNAVFLDNRVQGLQMFVNSVMSKEELRRCKMVREFFCLDEPPTYSESMEECRAIFEAQEETIAHLKMQINNKNDLILNLQQKLRDEILEKEQLKESYKTLTSTCPRCANVSNGRLSNN